MEPWGSGIAEEKATRRLTLSILRSDPLDFIWKKRKEKTKKKQTKTAIDILERAHITRCGYAP